MAVTIFQSVGRSFFVGDQKLQQLDFFVNTINSSRQSFRLPPYQLGLKKLTCDNPVLLGQAPSVSQSAGAALYFTARPASFLAHQFRNTVSARAAVIVRKQGDPSSPR